MIAKCGCCDHRTGSRDRQICIFRRRTELQSDSSNKSAGDSAPIYELVQSIPKAHDRIIWDLGWSWDEVYFASGSRDKTVKIWQLQNSVSESREETRSPDAIDGTSTSLETMQWAVASRTTKLIDSVTALEWVCENARPIYHVLALPLLSLDIACACTVFCQTVPRYIKLTTVTLVPIPGSVRMQWRIHRRRWI